MSPRTAVIGLSVLLAASCASPYSASPAGQYQVDTAVAARALGNLQAGLRAAGDNLTTDVAGRLVNPAVAALQSTAARLRADTWPAVAAGPILALASATDTLASTLVAFGNANLVTASPLEARIHTAASAEQADAQAVRHVVGLPPLTSGAY